MDSNEAPNEASVNEVSANEAGADEASADEVSANDGTTADAPPPSTARSRSLGASGAFAAVVAVLVFVASGTGYLVGRRKPTSATSASGSSSVAVPAFNNTNGGGSSFGGNFGGFGSATGTGSSSTSSSGSSSTASAAAAKVASKVDPAIVDVTSTLADGEALGTGMVITSDGEILTNYHVISGATSVHVQLVTTGKSYSATVVGYDASRDIALLKVADVSGLTTITTSGASAVGTGQSIVVIGNAYGQGGTPSVVEGAVTATNRTITASDETGYDAETLNGLIEMSAPAVSGDSGGAVADTSGRVVAMTTAAWAGNGTVSYSTSGEAYAIPIESALSVVHEIEAGNTSSTVHLGEHGILGVGVQTGNGGGAYVAEVESGSAAAEAGITAGDTITALNGTDVGSVSALNVAMDATHVGDHVTVQWQDANGVSHHATVALTDGVA